MSIVRLLNISSVSHRCAKEQRDYLRRRSFDPRFCFELFRRALAESEQEAWENILEIFSPLVSGWVLRHNGYPDCTESVEFFVQGAFVRFWSSLNGDHFDEEKELSELLQYLKRCVHSEIVDHLRRMRAPTVEMPDHLAADSPFPVDPIAVENLWNFVNGRLNDEKERIIVYASFFLDYKPREILAGYPTYFRNVKEIHRIKENVISRLRRIPGFEEYFEIHA